MKVLLLSSEYEKNGKVIKIIGIQEDINEQKTKSDMLTKTNERLTNAINKIPAPIALWDKEEKLIFDRVYVGNLQRQKHTLEIVAKKYKNNEDCTPLENDPTNSEFFERGGVDSLLTVPPIS